MKRIGIFGSECNDDKLPVIKGLFKKLNDLGAAVYVQSTYYDFMVNRLDFRPEISGVITEADGIAGNNKPDIALSVGGDGTFLRTVLQINRCNIPILGINTGRLGFLADVAGSQINDTLEELFRGEYRIEDRTLLYIDGGTERTFGGFPYALNEIAVLKRDTSSMITIHTYLNDAYLTSYQADGLVIATPTGSTAYSLSVNGPILLPENRNFVLSPVSPHSLSVRPIVVPDDCLIMLKVESRTNSFLVSLDGRSEAFETPNSLIIKLADFHARVVKRFNQTFQQVLREKLMWGADPRKVK